MQAAADGRTQIVNTLFNLFSAKALSQCFTHGLSSCRHEATSTFPAGLAIATSS
jgi:hypothetical protein